MLVFVQLIFFLSGTHAHPRLNVDIIIYTINIGKCMMNDIMFHIPHKTIATENVKRKRCEMIYPLVFAKAPMGAIMHYIKTDRCNYTTEQHTFEDREKSIWRKK